MRQEFQCRNTKYHQGKQKHCSGKIKRFLHNNAVFGYYRPGKRNCNNTNWNIDKENPVPGKIMRENTADCWTGRTTNRTCHGYDSKTQTQYVSRKTQDTK